MFEHHIPFISCFCISFYHIAAGRFDCFILLLVTTTTKPFSSTLKLKPNTFQLCDFVRLTQDHELFLGLGRSFNGNTAHCIIPRHISTNNIEVISKLMKYFKFFLADLLNTQVHNTVYLLNYSQEHKRVYSFLTPRVYHHVKFHFTLRHKMAFVC